MQTSSTRNKVKSLGIKLSGIADVERKVKKQILKATMNNQPLLFFHGTSIYSNNNRFFFK